MPYSGNHNKHEMVDYLTTKFRFDTPILDVGAGAGSWLDVLSPRFNNVTALEVHEPYIEQFCLRQRYQRVIVSDCRYYEFYHDYKVVIMGDVLEHLTAEDGVKLIERILPVVEEVIIVVPWTMEQGALDGVEWEVHRQTDITKEVMAQRYPGLKLFWECDRVGIYVKA